MTNTSIEDSVTLTTGHCMISVESHGDASHECACLDCSATAVVESIEAARQWGEDHSQQHQWDWAEPTVSFAADDARSDDPMNREALRASREAQERYEPLRRRGSGATRAEIAEAKQEMESTMLAYREMGHEWWLRVHRPESDDEPLPSEGFSAEVLGIDLANRPRVAKRNAVLHGDTNMVECGARTTTGGRCRHPITGTQCAAGHSCR